MFTVPKTMMLLLVSWFSAQSLSKGEWFYTENP